MELTRIRGSKLQDAWKFGLALVLVGSILLSSVFYLRGRSVLFYVAGTVTVATGLYVWERRFSPRWLAWKPSERTIRALHVVTFASITATALLLRRDAVARPTTYFVLYALVVGLVGYTALQSPSVLNIVEAVLVLAISSGSLFTAAPLIGVDTALHRNAVGYMMQTGDLIPRSVSYYHWYPVSYTTGAVVGLIGDLSPSLAFYLATTGTVLLSGTLIYVVTKRIAPEAIANRAGMLALLVVPISAQNLKTISIPIGQTLVLAFVPAILYLLVRERSWRFDALLIGSLVLVSFIHVLAPFVFLGVVGILLLYEGAEPTVRDSRERARETVRRPVVLGSVVGVCLFQYLMYIGMLNLQIGRILVLFTGGGDISNAVSNASDALSATDILFQVDPLLQFAGSLLLISLFVLTGVYGVVNDVLAGTCSAVTKWTVVCGVSYAGFAVAFIAGHGSNVGRAFPTVVLLISPIVGLAMVRTRNGLGSVGTGIVVFVLVSGAFFAVTSPASAVPERTTGFQSVVTESEMAAINYVGEHRIESYSHTYFAQRETSIQIADGNPSSYIRYYYNARFPPPDVFERFAADHPGMPFVHQTYYDRNGGVSPPDTYSTVYDSGGSTIVVPAQ